MGYSGHVQRAEAKRRREEHDRLVRQELERLKQERAKKKRKEK